MFGLIGRIILRKTGLVVEAGETGSREVEASSALSRSGVGLARGWSGVQAVHGVKNYKQVQK